MCSVLRVFASIFDCDTNRVFDPDNLFSDSYARRCCHG